MTNKNDIKVFYSLEKAKEQYESININELIMILSPERKFYIKSQNENSDIEFIEVVDENLEDNSDIKGSQNVSIDLFTINKEIISQLNDMTEEELKSKEKIISEFIKLKNNKFYMLYGKEISYFTLFNIKYSITGKTGKEIISCLKEIGTIKSIDLEKDKNTVEIWVKPFNDEEATCLYLFPYDLGVVEI